jgi:hypothetical protein
MLKIVEKVKLIWSPIACFGSNRKLTMQNTKLFGYISVCLVKRILNRKSVEPEQTETRQIKLITAKQRLF